MGTVNFFIFFISSDFVRSVGGNGLYLPSSVSSSFIFSPSLRRRYSYEITRRQDTENGRPEQARNYWATFERVGERYYGKLDTFSRRCYGRRYICMSDVSPWKRCRCTFCKVRLSSHVAYRTLVGWEAVGRGLVGWGTEGDRSVGKDRRGFSVGWVGCCARPGEDSMPGFQQERSSVRQTCVRKGGNVNG